MKKLYITPDEKIELERRHKLCKNVKECYRINAVLLRSEGWTVPMIAQALRIHESTVIRHLNDYKEGKLTIENGGSNSYLDEVQIEELIKYLEQHMFQTTTEIINYINEQYKISYTTPGINKWLHRNEFSYKQPKGYPHKASKEQQEQFIKLYENLKNTKKPEDSIMFMDSSHPSISTKVSYGWIKKGTDKPIETTASRTRINLVGALILNKLDAPVVCAYDTVDGDSIIDFLQQLRKYSKVNGNIYLILEQAGYHRSFQVKEEAEKLNIKLTYLPPYSPNLNPIERLWKVMNEHARNNKFFESAQKFRQSITDFYQKVLPKIASNLHLRINDNFQIDYAF